MRSLQFSDVNSVPSWATGFLCSLRWVVHSLDVQVQTFVALSEGSLLLLPQLEIWPLTPHVPWCNRVGYTFPRSWGSWTNDEVTNVSWVPIVVGWYRPTKTELVKQITWEHLKQQFSVCYAAICCVLYHAAITDFWNLYTHGCFPVLAHLMFPPNGNSWLLADQPFTYSLFHEVTFFRSEAVTFCFKDD